MLFEFSIIPVGTGVHISAEIAEALKLVDDSGLPYQLTPTGTCIEGDWDEVMSVIYSCHKRVHQMSPHVITSIKVEDDGSASGKLIRNITSVEEKAGRRLVRVDSKPPLA